jgi:membrane associated rhomboid family serine protease
MANPVQYPEHEAPRLTRAVQALIAANVAILFLQWTVVTDADVFAVLGLQNGDLQRTLVSSWTYMFAHYGLAHLAVNMYVLLAFGPRLESAMGTRAFTLYYLWCGLGGAVTHMLFVRTGILIGSSAAVFGVLFAYAQHWPNDEVALFGVVPVRTWTMLVLFTIVTLGLGMLDAGDVAGGDRIVYLAHLGGLAFGWLYFRTPPAASIERLRQRISPAPDYQDEAPPRAIPRTLPRQRAQRDEVDEIVAKSKALAAQQRPTRVVITPVRTALEAHAAELDRVLDKISSKGLASLTSDEHALLDATARRLRGEA